jgi:manganese/zinc/iron transport system permease protein
MGEALSHAAYPGVILGVLSAVFFGLSDTDELGIAIWIMIGAFLSALAGLWTIHFLERRLKVRSDSALCFVLSVFFGIGLTMASQVQFTHTSFYRQIQVYLYGQAATMTDSHIFIYGILAAIVVTIVTLFYKELQAMTFDQDYARTLGIPVKAIDLLTFVLIVLAVVIGIRSVGVVLMSAMLIAPAAAARQYTNTMSSMFLWAAFFGIASGYLGNVLSVELTKKMALLYPDDRLAFPTGPMIVIVASIICIFSLFFAPQRGLAWRIVRMAAFRDQCIKENILKSMWRYHEPVSFEQLRRYQTISSFYGHILLWRLILNGWVERIGPDRFQLTEEGKRWAARVVRLHRLWEVYLVDYLGMGVEKVHRNAEEMEHIITPEIEHELTLLLKDPKQDPHHQPIPPKE